MSQKILLLPGDGVGPEITAQVKRLLDWLNGKSGVNIAYDESLIGGASYDKLGTPLSDETLAMACDCDAVLLGAVGGEQWNDVERSVRPEAGLLRLRKELDLYANLRPAKCPRALAAHSSLKPELISDLDILIVRELTGGVYFGQPRGITTDEEGQRIGVDTQRYSESEITRLLHTAFALAGSRDGRLHSVEKANVMETGILWRNIANEIAPEYPEVHLAHMYADNCAMQLVRYPKQFDVIATDNLFGDILSDCAAMLTGSLGMLPSASLGKRDERGHQAAVYEPVHGSAPDIAGRNIANPLAMLLSLAMCLRLSLDLPACAEEIESAIDATLNQGIFTADIAPVNTPSVSTGDITDAILAQLR